MFHFNQQMQLRDNNKDNLNKEINTCIKKKQLINIHNLNKNSQIENMIKDNMILILM